MDFPHGRLAWPTCRAAAAFFVLARCPQFSLCLRPRCPAPPAPGFRKRKIPSRIVASRSRRVFSGRTRRHLFGGKLGSQRRVVAGLFREKTSSRRAEFPVGKCGHAGPLRKKFMGSSDQHPARISRRLFAGLARSAAGRGFYFAKSATNFSHCRPAPGRRAGFPFAGTISPHGTQGNTDLKVVSMNHRQRDSFLPISPP